MRQSRHTYEDVVDVAGSVRVEVPTVMVSDDDGVEEEVGAASMESDVEVGRFADVGEVSAIVVVS